MRLGLLLLLVSAPAVASELNAREEAGRRIYVEGLGSGGRAIQAEIGVSTRLPASSMPCASCHGADGLGRPEGGTQPPELVWSRLMRGYGHAHPNGRKHPAFTEATLSRVITEGLDPAGNRLDPTMPRYSLSREELSNLFAYLQRLEHQQDPGVTSEEIRIGTVLPTKGRLAETGRAMQHVLERACEQLNAGGGIHGRRVKLVVAGYDSESATGLESAQRLLKEEKVFALVSGFTPKAERDVQALAAKERVPLIGPLTLYAADGSGLKSQVFHLVSGLREQARALAEHAAKALDTKQSRAVVLVPSDTESNEAGQAAVEQFKRRGWTTVELRTFTRGRIDPVMLEPLQARGVDTVLFLGRDAELAVLLRKAEQLKWTPRWLASGLLASKAATQAPLAFDGRITLAYPTLPMDEKPSAKQAIAAFASQHQAAASAYSAAMLLSEGLRRTGQQVSRQRLVETLEKLYDFETGLLPPLSYGPRKRVGARGAWIVTVDLVGKTFRSAGGWVAVGE